MLPIDLALLLMTLSVLAVWALLGVLLIGLLLIFKALQSTRGWVEKVTMGVRAIEHQMAPLDEHADALVASLDEAATAVLAASRRVERLARELDAGRTP